MPLNILIIEHFSSQNSPGKAAGRKPQLGLAKNAELRAEHRADGRGRDQSREAQSQKRPSEAEPSKSFYDKLQTMDIFFCTP